VILAFGLIVLIPGTVTSALFLCRVSFLLVVSGTVIFLAGWEYLAAVGSPLAILVLMIPSSTLLDHITFPLQMVASKTATFMLSTLGIPVYQEGNIILLPSARLEVAEACSGVRSLFSLITLTVIYGYLAESKVKIRVLLTLIAVPVSVLANALRITVTGLVVEFWGLEGAEGTLHLLSGWLIFASSLALIFLFHRLAHNFLRTEQGPGGQGEYA
jgi:exosortase